jgi:ferric iron reductase protein FhuF
MIDSLAPVFESPLDFVRDVLSLRSAPGPGEPVRCADLLRPEVLGGLLDRYAVQHQGADKRAVVSMWTQYYSARLIYPVLGANLLLGRALPLALEDTVLHVAEDGSPLGFCIVDEGGRVFGTGMARFAPLVRQHLVPLVAAVAALGRVAPKLVWSNAGIRIAGTANIARRQGQFSPRDQADIDALLNNSAWPDGWANPLFQPYRTVETCGESVERRRIGCLRYLLPAFEGCGLSCPLPDRRGRPGMERTERN